MVKKIIHILITAFFMSVIGIGAWYSMNRTTGEKDGITYQARVSNDQFEVLENGKWKKISIKGVSMGMAKPGTFPSDAKITEQEYATWFEQIGAMNANTVRTYTLHPPGFYKALKDYNDTHEHKIYLFQGVWADESALQKTRDAYDQAITEKFQNEFKKITDAIHGNITIPKQSRNAYGTYNADVSQYTIGWIIGIEWYPYMVRDMAKKYKDQPDYEGTYVQSKNADGFEDWLAEQLDTLATYEIKNYQTMRPLSFTNWVPTDLLKHPAEPVRSEDLATVNPNLIQANDSIKDVGMFATYHVYPYYPDFLNLEKKYSNYMDHRGKENNFAGYLHDLKKAHQMPILIGEYGVPSSRGMAHRNVHGINQGHLTEHEQGEFVKNMHEDIEEAGMLGAVLFTWQDEWFKTTWNTSKLDNANRRPYWSNIQSPEQSYGLLRFDQMKIKPDGDVSDWGNQAPLYSDTDKRHTSLNNVYMDHDEQGLYVRVDQKNLNQNEDLHIFFNVNPNVGNRTVLKLPSLKLGAKHQFQLTIKGRNEAYLLSDPYVDPFTYYYGYVQKQLKPSLDEPPRAGSGRFKPIYQALHKELIRPDTKEVIPFDTHETGVFHHGNGNPESSEYDSLADYYVNETNGITEIKVPWMLLNIKDPSRKEALGDLYEVGLEGSIKINGIGLTVVTATGKTITDSFPEVDPATNKLYAPNVYSWEDWRKPISNPQLKQSYYIMQDFFSSFE